MKAVYIFLSILSKEVEQSMKLKRQPIPNAFKEILLQTVHVFRHQGFFQTPQFKGGLDLYVSSK